MNARRLRGLGIAGGIVIALELVCRAGLVRPTDLVPPTTMVAAMLRALADTATLEDLATTVAAVAASVILAFFVGMIGGVILHGLPRVRRACEPFIASYYALPLFALYPVLVVILGVGRAPVVFTGVLYAAMAVLISTLSGLDHIRPVFRKAARVHRLSPLGTLLRVSIPACATEILGGITLAVSYAFVAVIASEFLLAPAGIGHAIADAYTSFQIERMYGLMLVLALLVLAINGALRKVRTRLGAVA